jgi:hypothetical protein
MLARPVRVRLDESYYTTKRDILAIKITSAHFHPIAWQTRFAR